MVSIGPDPDARRWQCLPVTRTRRASGLPHDGTMVQEGRRAGVVPAVTDDELRKGSSCDVGRAARPNLRTGSRVSSRCMAHESIGGVCVSRTNALP
jgi:hypothetical protein